LNNYDVERLESEGYLNELAINPDAPISDIIFTIIDLSHG
jgi:hypothetical protein